jgi:hypothetical protein
MVSPRTLLAGSLLAALSLGSIALAHAAPAQPQTYALKPTDLSKGYVPVSSDVLNNAAMAKRLGVSKAQFDHHGRISGFQIVYEQHSSANQAFSYIYTYKTSAGAHWDYVQSTAHDLRAGGKRISATKVGTESVGLYAQQSANKLTAVFYVIHFRQGPIDNTVGVGGLKGRVTLAQAVHLAQVVAAREPKS